MYNMYTLTWILFAGGKMNSMITRLQTIKDMKRSSPTEKALSKYTGNDFRLHNMHIQQGTHFIRKKYKKTVFLLRRAHHALGHKSFTVDKCQ